MNGDKGLPVGSALTMEGEVDITISTHCRSVNRLEGQT